MKCKHKLIRLLTIGGFMTTLSFGSFAQQDNIWYFGDNAGLDFNGAFPVAISGHSMSTDEGCASVCDNLGQMLLYTDGQTIWDAANNPIVNGTGLLGDASSTQSSIIVQDPGNVNQYYVFTADAHGGGNQGIHYNLVDMNIAPNGGVVAGQKNQNILASNTTERIAAVCFQDPTGLPAYWIITVDEDADYYAFELTSGGLNTTPVITTHTTLGFATQGGGDNAVGYLKVSLDGTKICKANREQSNIFAEVADFDVTTGQFSNGRTINVNRIGYGVEFSPSGDYVYVGSFSRVYQYDANQTTSAGITASEQQIHANPTGAPVNTRIGALQLGPDQRIYVVNGHEFNGGNRIDIIPSPDAAVPGYLNDNITLLPGSNGFMGLPNFRSCAFSGSGGCIADAQFDMLVNGNQVDLTDNSQGTSTGTVVSQVWNVDGHIYNGPTASHIFTQTGTYEICLTITVFDETTDECCTDTLCQWVDIMVRDEPCFLDPGFQFFCYGNYCIYSFVGTSGNSNRNITSWFWDFGDGTTATGQFPWHVYAAPGQYEICLTIVGETQDGEECCTEQICETFEFNCEPVHPELCGETTDKPTPVIKMDRLDDPQPKKEQSDLLLVPNPSHETTTLYFEMPGDDDRVAIYLYNASGNKIGTVLNPGKLKGGKQSIDIHTANLNPGIYFIKVESSTGMKTIKLMVN